MPLKLVTGPANAAKAGEVLGGLRGSGQVCVNGAAARLVHTGDKVIVVSYAEYEEAELENGHEPRVVHVDERNAIVDVDSAVGELLR